MHFLKFCILKLFVDQGEITGSMGLKESQLYLTEIIYILNMIKLYCFIFVSCILFPRLGF